MALVRSIAGAGVVLAVLGPALAAANPPTPAAPAAVPDKVSYARDVLPLFQQYCLGCHQPAKAGGNYIMISRDALLLKGDSDQPGIVPGKPQDSYLLAKVTPGKDGKASMPRGQPPLSGRDVALITKWITQGAVDD